MTNAGSRRFGATLLGLAAAVAILSGCGTSIGHQEATVEEVTVPAAGAVVVVAGTHANAPIPSLGVLGRAVVDETVRAGGPVDVVHVAATPTLDQDLKLKTVEGTEAGKIALVEKNLHRVDEALHRASDGDGSDLLESVAMAAGRLRSVDAESPALIVADPGLADSGRLQLTTEGMLEADPEDVARYLNATGSLPDLTGTTTYLVGFGYTTSPQSPLDAPLRARVAALWTAVFEAAGATVRVDSAPNTNEALETTFSVRTVDLPAAPAQPPVCTSDEIVFGGRSDVSFVAESDSFVDAERARAALLPIAQWLVADSRRTASIQGTTADDGSAPERLQALGLQRASAVVAELRNAGASELSTTAMGVGSEFPEYVRPDRDTMTGELLPGPAALNRSVRILLDDPC